MKLSLRSQNILKDRLHESGKSESAQGRWEFSLQANGESFLSSLIVYLSYSLPHSAAPLREEDLLFLETLSRLSSGRSVETLNRMTFREIENYLRDENHEAAFDVLVEKPFIESFERVKNSLLASILKKKLKEISFDRVLEETFHTDWDALTFVEKNRLGMLFISQINSLFPNEKGLQLLLVEGDIVNIISNGFPLSLDVLKDTLNDYFLGSDGKTSLKVVAAL